MIKKYALPAGLCLLLSLSSFAQISQRTIDKTNCREGEEVEYCLTHKKMHELLKDPANQKFTLENELLQEQSRKAVANGVEKGIVYKIPVVFHVLHNNGIENISRAQIEDAVSILNRDFRRLNDDAATVATPFQGMPSDVEIEFVLATKAPNGACFSGITRTRHALALDGEDGGDQVDAIVAGNDVYQGQWPGNKYMNIFVCGEIGGAAGYTTKPWMSNMTNGIWILYNYVGSIEHSNTTKSRAMTHEVGHWLNLDHTWGGNNNPGNASSCSTDDDVDDTPVCIGVTSCQLSGNTCDDLNTAGGVSSSWGTNVIDNVENYMDYSYCSKMFTPGQKTRMRAALLSSVGGRSNLWTTSNLNATGATGAPATLCKTDFTMDKTIVCAGDSIVFTDETYNAATGWNWTTTGGTPASSTDQHPVITYNSPGTYSVTLSATDGSTTDVETKSMVINVLPAGASLPFYDGFESYTTLASSGKWFVDDINESNPFTLVNGVAHSGTKSVKLSNFNETGSGTDELSSTTIDLSSLAPTDNMTMSFRYSYKKKTSSNSEVLKIIVTSNCGDTWITRKTISGGTLSSLTTSSAWTPSSTSDWTTVHVTSITSAYFSPNFRFKFRFEGSGGNNLYLDDINLYSGDPSETIISAGINEQNSLLSDIGAYPNPTDGALNVHFSIPTNEKVELSIQDITGKIAQSQTVLAKTGSNLVMLDNDDLSAGLYFLSVRMGSNQRTIQFVVK
jgi:PKD repeat protein